MIVKHKLADHIPHPSTEILILGLWMPDRVDSPEFFYGWGKSYLWHLLPICYGEESLKEASLKEKTAFMLDKKIDFADVIRSLDANDGEEGKMDDPIVDSSVNEWTDLISIINSLPNLKAVYFTRKTFNGIPNARVKVMEAVKHCLDKNIRFCKLDTPAKYFDNSKQQQWRDTIVTQKTCLRP